MLWRVTAACNHVPSPAANLNAVAIGHAFKRIWQTRDGFPEATKADAIGIERILIPARRTIKSYAVFGRFTPCISNQCATGQIFQP